MTQQINLLRTGPSALTAALQLGAVAAVVAVAAIAYSLPAARETSRLGVAVAEGDARIARLREAIAGPKPGSDDETVLQLQAEIADLRLKVEGVKQLMAAIRQGQADSAKGLTEQLLVVAAVPHDDAWITGVEIGNGGQSVIVNGQAMHNEAAIHYAKALSDAYRTLGIGFRTLEIAPVSGAPAGLANRAGPVPVAFKLS
jgi:hypothetical protein